MCNLCLNKIKLNRICNWGRRWLNIIDFICSDKVDDCVVDGDGCLGWDDDEVVGYLSPDECTFYLLIQTFTAQSFTNDEDGSKGENVVDYLNDWVTWRKHQIESKVATYWIKFVESCNVKVVVNAPIDEDS